MFHILHEEGVLSKHGNMHLGSRSMLFDKHYDLGNDARCGFSYIRAREMDMIGIEAIIEKIVKTVKDEYVYVSIDIDVLDPGKFLRFTYSEALLISDNSFRTGDRYYRARRLDFA